MRKRSSVVSIVLIALMVGFYFIKTTGIHADGADLKLDRSISHFTYTKHARCRMDCRQIDEQEVKEIFQKGTINYSKSQLNDKPDPKYALEGVTDDGQQVRIIFATSRRGMVVITVIDLKEEWPCACK